MVCFLYKFPVWNINGGKKRITLKVADVSRELIGDVVNFFLQLLTIVSLVWNIEYSADVGRKLKRRYNLINQVFSTPDWRLFPVWNIKKTKLKNCEGEKGNSTKESLLSQRTEDRLPCAHCASASGVYFNFDNKNRCEGDIHHYKRPSWPCAHNWMLHCTMGKLQWGDQIRNLSLSRLF